MILFLKLLIAHCLGDFVLQPETWVKEKQKKKLKSSKLYVHIAIHTFLLLVVLEFNKNYFLGILGIVFSHFCIDVFKLYSQNKKNKKKWFFMDQALHILMLLIVVYLYHPFDFSFIELHKKQALLLVAAFLFVAPVSSVVIKTIINQWNPESKKESDHSLAKAGRFIGILERLLTFLFVITNHWPAIGFLIAAKSVFRFGDLTNSNDRKLTEYILIGTLLSFGLAILIGVVYSYLILEL